MGLLPISLQMEASSSLDNYNKVKIPGFDETQGFSQPKLDVLSVNNKIIQITIESNSNVLQIIDPDWRMSVLFPICLSLIHI